MNSLRKIRISVSFAILVLMLTIGGANVFAQDIAETAETAEAVSAELIEKSNGEKTPEETDAITGGLGASGFEAITATTYAFAATTATLEDMTTGTTQLVAAGSDDGASPVTNIGFDFWYDGVRYNQFSCNANGLCRLGSLGVSTSFDNASATTGFATTTNSPKIAPYYDDLWIGTNGKIHFKVVGTAGSRKLVVEFQNMTIPRQAAATTGNETFQLWLFESASTTTPGVIEFVYGDGIVANAVQGGYTVGLQSGAATNLASVTTSTNTVSYTTANNTQTDAIASGTAYTFTPNIPAAPTNPTTSATAVSVTLNWTDNATNEFGYVIYRSLDGVNFTFLAQTAANTTTYTDTAVAPSTTYTYQIFAVTEGALSNPALVVTQATTAPGNDTCAGAGGNYSDPATWADGTVPTAGDNVTIQTGCTVTVDTANAAAFNLTIDSGGTLQSPLTGAVTTQVLTVGANLTNNGTLDFSTNANTSGAGLTFTGATSNTFSGTGAVTDVRTITINKGTSSANILELNTSNFTVQGVATDVAGFLTLTNGTFKLSGTFAGTNRVFTSAGYTITATGGFWLNNPNYVVAGQTASPTVSGLFRITQGTFNIGTATGNSIGFGTGANVIVEGGIINATGRFGVSASASAITYNQSAGTITTCTIGNASTTLACFDLGSSVGSTIAISGGTIVVRVANTAATGPRDYRNQGGTTGITTVTGGTLQLGDALSPAAVQAFDIAGVVPNLVVTNTTANHTVTFLAPVGFNNITLNITLNTGTALNTGANAFLFFGTNITNNGTITGPTGSNFVIFNNTANISYTGTGTATFVAFAIQAGGAFTFTIDPASPNIVTNAVRLFSGSVINSNKITVGNGGATGSVVQIGNTTTPTDAGTFDQPLTFNPGTGAISIIYLRTTPASRTTGGEIPATRTITNLTYDNNAAGATLTLAGGNLLVTGTMTLTNGVILTGTSILIHNGTAARTNGYVDGNLSRSYTATGAYTYFVGQNGYSPVTATVSTLTTNPSDLMVKAVDTTLPGLADTRSASRFWTLTETGDLAATLAFTYIDPADVNGNEADYRLFRRAGTLSEVPATVDPATNTATTTSPITEFSDWGIGVLAVPGTVQFDPATYSVVENVAGGIVTVTVTRTGGSDGTITASYATVAGGGATATGGTSCTTGVDYIDTSGTLTFVQGDTTESFAITICPDSDIEPDEVIAILLGGANVGAQNTATVTITNDDFDTTPPSVVISQATGQTDPTTATTINFTVTFSEPVADFTSGDVTVGGTAFGAGSTPVVNVTGSGTTYNVSVTGYNQSGTVIISIAAGVAHDAAGNGNTASTGDGTVTVFVGATTLFVDDDGMAGAGNCNATTTSFTTIQSAIDAASNTNTIVVCPGVYNERLVINKSLTINGAQAGNLAKPRVTPANESTIVVDNSPTIPVDIEADNVTFNGFAFDINQTFPSTTATDKPAYIILGNTVTGFGADGYNNIRILNNRLAAVAGYETGTADRRAIGIATAVDSIIEGNFIANYPSQSVTISDGSTNLIYRNNDSFNAAGSSITLQSNFQRELPQRRHVNYLIENNRFDQDGALLFLSQGGIIRNNTFTQGLDEAGILMLGGNDGVNITTNTFALSNRQAMLSSDGGFSFGQDSNISFTGNTVTRVAGATTTGSFAAIDYRGTGGSNTISNNTLLLSGTLPAGNSTFGIRLRGSASGNFTINGNLFDGGNLTASAGTIPTAGLNIISNAAANGTPVGNTGLFPASSVVTMNCNSIIRFQDGISVFDTTNNVSGGLLNAANILINNNNIQSNTNFGINNAGTSATLNAENNYWGSPSGPGPVGPGTGDRVTANVDFTPFATAPTCGPTASGATLEGRVQVATGKGIVNTKLTLTDSAGRSLTVLTDKTGKFIFTEVPTGETYILSIHSKKYQFAEPTRVITVNENLSGIDFTAN